MTVLLNNLACLVVTVYLPRCLMSKRCSMPGLNCGYIDPHIKLKLVELASKLYLTKNLELKCIVKFFTTPITQINASTHITKKVNFVIC